MKSFPVILFLLVLFGAAREGVAQMSITTSTCTQAYWDDEAGEYVVVSTESTPTLFEFNERMTMFEHTTSSISSTYYIKSIWHDEENEQFELDVVSDVGNRYLMIIDLVNQNVRFVFTRQGVSYLLQHAIKSSWEEDALLQ